MSWPLSRTNPDRDPGFRKHVPTIGAETVLELGAIAPIVGYVVFDLGPRWLE